MNPLPETSGIKIALLLCSLVLITISSSQAQCIASGPNSPGSASSVSFAGSDYSFTSPVSSFASDNVRSTAQSVLFNGETEYLQATDFGFSIPAAHGRLR